jgi:hypothetical protein
MASEYTRVYKQVIRHGAFGMIADDDLTLVA